MAMRAPSAGAPPAGFMASLAIVVNLCPSQAFPERPSLTPANGLFAVSLTQCGIAAQAGEKRPK